MRGVGGRDGGGREWRALGNVQHWASGEAKGAHRRFIWQLLQNDAVAYVKLGSGGAWGQLVEAKGQNCVTSTMRCGCGAAFQQWREPRQQPGQSVEASYERKEVHTCSFCRSPDGGTGQDASATDRQRGLDNVDSKGAESWGQYWAVGRKSG